MPSAFTGPLAIREVDVDHEIWCLVDPLVWEIDYLGSGDFITVPAGFCSDGASIPWPLSIVLPRWGRWRRAACLHDHLYEMLQAGAPDQHAPTRKDADRIFREALLASGVWRMTAFAFWLAVRTFGGF